MTAEYRSLGLSGKIVANIRLGSREYLSQIVVADIAVDGTIGFDFMSEYKCALDIPNHVLSINGDQHSLLGIVEPNDCFLTTNSLVGLW